MKKLFLALSLFMSLSIHSENKSVSLRKNPIMRMINSAVLFIGTIAVFNQVSQADVIQDSFSCSDGPCVHEGAIECKNNDGSSASIKLENIKLLSRYGQISMYDGCQWECNKMTLNGYDKYIYCSGKCPSSNNIVDCEVFFEMHSDPAI